MNNDIKFVNVEWRTWYSLTNFEDRFRVHVSLIYEAKTYMWLLEHLYVGLIPNPSSQLAELIVYIIPQELICMDTRSYYVTRVYCISPPCHHFQVIAAP